MLVLTRRLGESIRIGDDICVRVMDIQRNQVRVAIEAPREIPVHREEVYEQVQIENQRAAAWISNDEAAELLDLLAWIADDNYVFFGYRWYDAQGITPAYNYGFGLSYTTFSYSGLQVSGSGTDLTVSALITNTGSRAGTEIAQLYVAIPDPGDGLTQPPRQLKGFARIDLAPGQSGTVQFELDERSFAAWDTTAGEFSVVSGCHSIEVGPQSRDSFERGPFV